MYDRPDLVHEHLVGPWLTECRRRSLDGVEWAPTLVSHRNPDFDAIAAALLAVEIVEHGGLERWGSNLANYAFDVDQGFTVCQRSAHPDDVRPQLHMLILILTNFDRWPEPDSKTQFRSAVQSSEFFIRLAGESSDKLPPDALVLCAGMALMREWCSREGVDIRGDAAQFGDEIQDWFRTALSVLSSVLSDDYQLFLRKDLPLLEDLDLELPTIDGGTRISVGGLAHKPLACLCDKYYIRAFFRDGNVELTVLPKPVRPGTRHRTIVAIQPDVAARHGKCPVSLVGLGAALERAEQAQRKQQSPPGIDLDAQRHGKPRYTEFPGIGDPWYDGRDHGYSIIDSPRDGSVLDVNSVVEILRSPFWIPPLTNGKAWDCPRNRETLDHALGDRAKATVKDLPRLVPATRVRGIGAFRIALGKVDRAWGELLVSRSIDALCGPHAERSVGPGWRVYCGELGALVDVKFGALGPNEVGEHPICKVIAEEWQTVLVIRAIGAKLAEDPRIRSGRLTELKQELLTSACDPRSMKHSQTTTRQGSPDDFLAVRSLCREVFGTPQLIGSVGAALEQADEILQRAHATMLNWVVVTLAVVSAIQTIVAIADYRSAKRSWDSATWLISFMNSADWIVWATLVVGLLVAGWRYRSVAGRRPKREAERDTGR